MTCACGNTIRPWNRDGVCCYCREKKRLESAAQRLKWKLEREANKPKCACCGTPRTKRKLHMVPCWGCIGAHLVCLTCWKRNASVRTIEDGARLRKCPRVDVSR